MLISRSTCANKRACLVLSKIAELWKIGFLTRLCTILQICNSFNHQRAQQACRSRGGWRVMACYLIWGCRNPFDPLGSDRPVEPYDDWMNCRSEELCKGVSKFLTSTTQRFWTGLDTSVRSFAHVDLLIRNIRGISLFQDSQGLVTHKRSDPNFNT